MAVIYASNSQDVMFGTAFADTIHAWDITNPQGDQGPADETDDIQASVPPGLALTSADFAVL